MTWRGERGQEAAGQSRAGGLRRPEASERGRRVRPGCPGPSRGGVPDPAARRGAAPQLRAGRACSLPRAREGPPCPGAVPRVRPSRRQPWPGTASPRGCLRGQPAPGGSGSRAGLVPPPRDAPARPRPGPRCPERAARRRGVALLARTRGLRAARAARPGLGGRGRPGFPPPPPVGAAAGGAPAFPECPGQGRSRRQDWSPVARAPAPVPARSWDKAPAAAVGRVRPPGPARHRPLCSEIPSDEHKRRRASPPRRLPQQQRPRAGAHAGQVRLAGESGALRRGTHEALLRSHGRTGAGPCSCCRGLT